MYIQHNLIVYYHFFVISLCIGTPATAASNTTVNKPSNSNGSGLISFSLKKKPVS